MTGVDAILPQVLAIVGGGAVVWQACPSRRTDWPLILGYGYVVGLTLGSVALYIAGIAGLGVRFAPAAGIQLVLCALALVLLRWFVGAQANDASTVAAPLRTTSRIVLAAIAAILLFRLTLLGMDATGKPLYPWDAWEQWATKARVWFETAQLRPFVSPDEWLRQSDRVQAIYTDAHPDYPPLVPLMQVWTLGNAAAWDDSALGITWVMLLAALGLAIAGQVRRATQSWTIAAIAAYLTLSLPILDTHAALPGYADLPIAAAYGLAFMSSATWVAKRGKGDAALAFLFVALLPLYKRPGVAWAVTLLPFLLAAISREGFRRLTKGVLRIAIAGTAVAIAYGLWHGVQLAAAVTSVVANLFAFENWHLLWYLVVLLVVVTIRRRRTWSDSLYASGAALGLGGLFLATVYFGTDLSASIADVTTLNRGILPLAMPAVYFLALLVHPDLLHLKAGDAGGAQRESA